MKSLKIITLLALCVSTSSCQETCGVTSEPLIRLNFVNMATPKFKNIVMQGSIKDLPNSGTAKPLNGNSLVNIHLPLNLNANSTTYVFEQANRKDTLTIYYRVFIRNSSLACGNILDIESSGIKPKTTFKQIDITYDTYYDFQSRGYEGERGISVNITEL